MPKKPRVPVDAQGDNGAGHRSPEAGYAAMAADEAREADVQERLDAFAGDIADEPVLAP